MLKIFFKGFYFFLFCSFCFSASYEIKLTVLSTNPQHGAILVLRNPMDQRNEFTGFDQLLDCYNLRNNPDWGTQGKNSDDPKWLRKGSYEQNIIADQLNDPGFAKVFVVAMSEAVTCVVEVVSWPKIQSFALTNVVEVGLSNSWYVTNLPCAKPVDFKVISAIQKKNGKKMNHIKMKINVESAIPLYPSNNFFTASIGKIEWITKISDKKYDKVNKKLTTLTLGYPKSIIVKFSKKKNTIIVDAKYEKRLASIEDVIVFFSLNGHSSYDVIKFDKNSKYKYKTPKH